MSRLGATKLASEGTMASTAEDDSRRVLAELLVLEIKAESESGKNDFVQSLH